MSPEKPKAKNDLAQVEASPTLIVNPIDRSASGSWREVKLLMKLSSSMSGSNFDPKAMVDFMNIIELHCESPDGADVGEILDAASFDDMMELASSIAGSEESVGEVNGVN
ncbi:MAG: hypothetical protein GY748_23235 [Planctomycetaceae bacterium]|nr:hypothetical protein [Planctomycetaceae bacterium]